MGLIRPGYSHLSLSLHLLGLGVFAAPAAAQQVVIIDATYTATSENTSDSHYRVDPDVETPANWRAPVDYAAGKVHARLEVLEKPSAVGTLYNICFEATPSYACMPYSPEYTEPGVYDFEYPFSAFYQYDQVDWSQGTERIALILKDEGETKVQGDPDFYPTRIHITLTLLAPGTTYEPPPPHDPLDAGVMDAGLAEDAAAPAEPAPVPDAATPPVMVPPPASSGAGGAAGMLGTGTAGQPAGSPPAATAGTDAPPTSAPVTAPPELVTAPPYDVPPRSEGCHVGGPSSGTLSCMSLALGLAWLRSCRRNAR